MENTIQLYYYLSREEILRGGSHGTCISLVLVEIITNNNKLVTTSLISKHFYLEILLLFYRLCTMFHCVNK